MSKKLLNLRGEKRREIYMIASRDPWLLWRLKAMDAGHVPPLLPGRVPPDMLRATLGSLRDDYEAVVLQEHARRFQTKQRSAVRRTFTLFMTLFIVVSSLAIVYAVKTGPNFKIEFLETIYQQRSP